MYVSGDTTTFVSRMHQLPTGIGDMTNFEIEGHDYTGIPNFHVYKMQRIMHNTASILTQQTSGYVPSQFFTGRKHFGFTAAAVSWIYNFTGADNLITHHSTGNFDLWNIDSVGSVRTSSGIYLAQKSTTEYVRTTISGLTPSTQYWLKIVVAQTGSGSAVGNIRVQNTATDGSNFDPVYPNNTVNFDFPIGTGTNYGLFTTDATNSGSHQLCLRHAVSPDGAFIRISDVALYPIPSRSSAKVAVLGDRTSTYLSANANLVARAILSTTGDTLNIIGVGDYADGSTQYAVNDDVKTGIGSRTGISGLSGNMYMVPGNWDYTNDPDLSNFRDYFSFNGFTYPGSYNGSGSYKMTLGNIDFFLIDDSVIKDAATSTDAQALPEGQFLLTGLAASTAPWKIVVWHYPSHTSSSHHSQTVYTSKRWNWSGLGVQVVLSSHDHVYERSFVSGCYFYTLGIGGGTINAFAATPQQYSNFTGLQYGYLKIYDSATDLILEYRGVQDNGSLTVPCHLLNDRVRIARTQA